MNWQFLSPACLFVLLVSAQPKTLQAAPGNHNVEGTEHGYRHAASVSGTRRDQSGARSSPGQRLQPRGLISRPSPRPLPTGASAFVPASNSGSIFFVPPTYGSGGGGARAVVVEDFNGDGKPDLAVTNHCFDSNCTSGSVAVLLGKGDGTYQPAVVYDAAGYFTQSITAGDFNGDGKLDLALANQCSDIGCTNGSVTVLLGNGDGSFRGAVSYASGGDASFVTAGDLNGDGKLDLVVANYEIDNVGVLLGNGDGTFQSVSTYPSGGENASSVALADLNGDGRLDIAVTNYLSGTVAVLPGNGNGTFQSAVSYSTGGALASTVVVADFNHDNKPDLAVANVCDNIDTCSSGLVAILPGNGDGSFKAPLTFSSAGQNSYSLAVGDFNGDGRLDLAVSNESSSNNQDGSVSLFLGVGDGTFLPGTVYDSEGFGSFFSAVGDFDGDGIADLVMSNDCTNELDCTAGSVIELMGKGDGAFHAPISYPAGGVSLNALAVGDFNADGKPDVVAASLCESLEACSVGAIGVLLGKGDGTFQPAVSYDPGGANPQSVVVGDFNSDGKPDLALVNNCASSSDCSHKTVALLLGNGDGTFQPAVSFDPGIAVTFLAAADFNGDGKLDLALGKPCFDSTCSNGGVNIVLGNGNGTFQVPVSYPSGGFSTSEAAVADFNHDGKPDLVLTNRNCSQDSCVTGSVSVLLGNGDGTFQAAITSSSGDFGTFSLAVGDFDGDGKLDLAVSNLGQCTLSPCRNDTVSILLGNGNGTFQTATIYPASSLEADSIGAGDFNGDGKLDLVLSNRDVLLGNGDGTFQAAQSYNPGANIGPSAVVADFNGDGKPDLAVATGDFATILLDAVAAFQNTTSTALTSSANPANFRQLVTFTATVTSNAQGAPSGSVTFSDGEHALGSVSVDSGRATFSTFSLDAGVHSITVGYGGDPSFLSSTSPELEQTIRADTRIQLTSSRNPSRKGQPVVFTAVVIPNSGGTPAGKIVFTDFLTVLGTVEMSQGQAALRVSRLHRGPHIIRAIYSGSSIDRRSSAVLAQRVR